MSDRQSTFSGTKEVTERLRFDVGRLEAFMGERVKGFAGPIAVKQFKGGQSNPTYLLETAARRPASSCPRRMRSIASTG